MRPCILSPLIPMLSSVRAFFNNLTKAGIITYSSSNYRKKDICTNYAAIVSPVERAAHLRDCGDAEIETYP